MRFFRTKVFYIFITFVMCVLIYLSTAKPEITGVFGRVVGVAFAPFQKIINTVERQIQTKLVYFNDIVVLTKENGELKARIDELEKTNRELSGLKPKFNEMQEVFKLKDSYSESVLIGGNIIAKDPGNYFDVFTIDAGSNDGLSLDNPVVTSKGLVGRISEVGFFTSRVTSIIDPDSSVSARISKTRDLVVVKGDISLKQKGLCKMDYIPSDVDVAEGDIIETSGIGGIFPKGILIGKVIRVIQTGNEFTKRAEISPVVDLKRIEEVYTLSRKK